MHKQHRLLILIPLLTLLILSACSADSPTEDWKTFAIEEETKIDIQFRLPPNWYVDYSPADDTKGQWDVVLVPPYCAEDQETEYEDTCVTLEIMLKDESSFDTTEFLTNVSNSMTLNQAGDEETMLMAITKSEVGDFTFQRYDHKFFIGDDEVQLSFTYFETENAYYYFVTEFPYDERDGDTADEFNLLIESIEPVN